MIDLNYQIKNLDTGEVIALPSGKPYTLRQALLAALGNEYGGTQKIKQQMHRVATKIRGVDRQLDLSEDELGIVEISIGRFFSAPMILGQIWDCLGIEKEGK